MPRFNRHGGGHNHGFGVLPGAPQRGAGGRHVAQLVLVWIVGGVLSLAGALSLAELGAAMPEAGGIYVYLREAYGKLFAFLYGWGMLLVIHSGSAATLAVAFGIYSATFFPLTHLEQKLVASG